MIDTRSVDTDRALVQLVDQSLPFHAASRVGDHLVAAWQSSVLARASRTWSANPLDRRVRLVSVVAIAAILTHIALTGFSTPEPTWWARATWVALIVLAAAVGLSSRGVAAAWTAWAARRASEGRVQA
jgi:hypothetical protein